jgi:hypothetical protein
MAKEKFQMTVYLNSMCPIEVHEANVGWSVGGKSSHCVSHWSSC